jgi:hypothetical protein
MTTHNHTRAAAEETRGRRYAARRDALGRDLLFRVIRGLEADDSALRSDLEPAHAFAARILPTLRGYHDACVDLLQHGPFVCTEAVAREQRRDADAIPPLEMTALRADLLELLRNTVRMRAGGPPPARRPTPSVILSACLVDGQVRVAAEGTSRELLYLQLFSLLQAVGLANVRACAAPECGRLYVRTYSRMFCSTRCQKRINTRTQRRRQRDRARANRKKKGSGR